MKTTLTLLLLSLSLSFYTSAQNTDISDKRPTADIQVQVLDEQGNWQRLKEIPNREYPTELATMQGQGCAITQFTVAKSGAVKDIEITNTSPKRYGIELKTQARKFFRKWQWPEQEQEQAFNLTMRVDYCFNEVSTRSEVVEQCLIQSQQTCV